jgi:hypothetical protein
MASIAAQLDGIAGAALLRDAPNVHSDLVVAFEATEVALDSADNDSGTRQSERPDGEQEQRDWRVSAAIRHGFCVRHWSGWPFRIRLPVRPFRV